MLDKFHVGSADLGCWDLYHSNQPNVRRGGSSLLHVLDLA